MAAAVNAPHHRATAGSGEDMEMWRSTADRLRQQLDARLANPLAGYSHAELADMGEAWARRHIVRPYDDDIAAFRLGAVCAQDSTRSSSVAGLSERDRDILRDEFMRRWKQPCLLYILIAVCSVGAAAQGMGKQSSHLSDHQIVSYFPASHFPFLALALLFLLRRLSIKTADMNLRPLRHRPNSRQRRADILRAILRHPRPQQPRVVASRPRQLGAIPLLRRAHLRAHCAAERVLRPPPHRYHRVRRQSLDGGRAGVNQHLAAVICRAHDARARHRPQERHDADMGRRVRAAAHTRRARHAETAVDGIGQ